MPVPNSRSWPPLPLPLQEQHLRLLRHSLRPKAVLRKRHCRSWRNNRPWCSKQLRWQHGPAQAAKQAAALEAAAKKSILFGGMRRQPTQVRNGDHGALRPALLESNLGIAWEPGRGGRAEAEREKASRAAQAEYQKKLDAAIAARKESAKRSREEPSRCCGGPCLCTPEGALEMLREERREWQTALDSTVKVAKGATFLARWLAQSGGAPAAE